MTDETAEVGAPVDETVKNPEPEAPETETADPSPADAESETAEQPEGEAPEGGESDEEKTRKTRVQKRIDQLTKEKHEALREAARLRAEVQAKQQPATPSGPAPKPEDFDYDAQKYAEAYADWKINEQQAQQRAKQESAQQADQTAEQATRAARLVDTGRSQFDDFDEVVMQNPNLPISQDMVDVLAASEKGADIAYYLGNNPEKAHELSQMQGVQLAYAMGRLETSLSAPAAKPVTQAPPPPKKVSGKAPAKKDPSQMSTEEWMKWRQSQLRKS